MADIVITCDYRRNKGYVRGVSDKGMEWIINNADDPYTVGYDVVEELAKQLREEGLEVDVR